MTDLFEYLRQIAMWVKHLTRESEGLGSNSVLVCLYFSHPITILSKVNSKQNYA